MEVDAGETSFLQDDVSRRVNRSSRERATHFAIFNARTCSFVAAAAD